MFADAAFMSPIFGKEIGGCIGHLTLVSWQWSEWVTLIISGLVLALIVFLQPETYVPVLLRWEAAYRAEIDKR